MLAGNGYAICSNLIPHNTTTYTTLINLKENKIMASNKLGLILLLVIGIVMVGGMVKAEDDKGCPEILYLANYMTCPSTDDLQLKPVDNCCEAPEGGCTFYLKNGEKIKCEEDDKICILVDEGAEYMTCSYAGDIHLKPASNCCFAPKGCTLHLPNGQELHCN